MKILWLIDLEYESGMRHGAQLRFFSLSRELVSMGHEVYFVTSRKATDDPIRKCGYLNDLVQEKVISGHLEVSYAPPARARRRARLAVYPALVNRFLRQFQEPPRLLVEGFLRTQHIDLCIFTSRQLLFLVEHAARICPTLIDWIDSEVLYFLREITLSLKKGQLTVIPYRLHRLVDVYTKESYYGRRCHLNLAVSGADKRCLDLVNGRPQQNRVLSMGVRMPSLARSVTPIKDRLIFSGNMGFPPNYEGALWFIDRVLPLLVERKPGISFVVAGANPVPELLARNGRNVCVTGFVEDLALEIGKSELCVAPLISGSGFKIKIAEAIAANRFVVATSRAVEFLAPNLRSGLLVADTPQAMADHVLSYLDDPSRYGAALAALRERIAREFTWANRAEELLQIARPHVGLRTGAAAPAGGEATAQRSGDALP